LSAASGSTKYGGGTNVAISGDGGLGEFNTVAENLQVTSSGITVGFPVTFDTTKLYTLPNGDRVSAELDVQNFIGTYNFFANYKPQTNPVQGLQAGVDITGGIADETRVVIAAQNINNGRLAQNEIQILGDDGTVTGITARAGHTTANAPYTASIFVPGGTATGTEINVNAVARESAGEFSNLQLKLLDKGPNAAKYDGTVTSTVALGDTAITLDANGMGRIRDQITSQDGADVKTMAGNSLTNYADANLNLDAWTASAHVTSDSTFNVYAAGNPARTIQGAVDAAMPGDAASHDTIILRDAATYFESVTIPAKTLDVFGQGYSATAVDGSGINRIFYIQPDAVINFNGFTIQNGFTTGIGGAILNYGDLNLHGNMDIKNNHADNDGGAICNSGSGNLVIDGARIYNNDADDDGGAIYNTANTGTLTVNGGNIYGNHADHHGGAIVHYFGETTINGGNIHDNTAGDRGGAIWVDWRNFVMNGGDIHNNVAANNGGGIDQTNGYGGPMIINGGSIQGNTAANGGGGIHNGASGTVNFVGGTIDGNNAYRGGGVWNEGTFNMGGGAGTPVISNNHATYGGGVGNYIVAGGNPQFNMHSGVIENNVATNSGGGVYNGGTFIMSTPGSTTAPTIQGNSAHWGGGVYNTISNGPALFTMWNGNILNNDAVANNALTPSGGMGGGIYNQGGSVTLIQGMVQGNEAFAGSAGTNAQKTGKGGGIYNEVVGGIGGTGTINLGANAYVYMNTAHNSGSAGRGGGIYTDGLAAARIFGPWANVNTNTPNNIWDALGVVT
jgi:hypothetical protein